MAAPGTHLDLVHFLKWNLDDMLQKHLSDEDDRTFFTDEAGLSSNANIDIHLEVDGWKDLTGLRKQLKSYGLELVKELRTIDALVIKDKLM